DRVVAEAWIAGKERIKGISFASIVVKGRRDLEVHVFREVQPCTNLPSQHESVRVRDQSASADRARANRIFRIRIVVNKLREVRKEIDRDLVWLGHERRDRLAIFALSSCRRLPAPVRNIESMF